MANRCLFQSFKGLALSSLALAGLFTASAPAPAAEPSTQPQGQRPRIGLVLGGGGAKGAAHIGVIKVLEELRIPVDCIAGTSMGAIVGAAYATGLTSPELEKVITSVNWKATLSSAPREDVPVQRKKYDYFFVNGLELGLKDGKVEFPLGIVPTNQIENLFRIIVGGARQTNNFSELPIPFTAVATDIESGEMVVMDRGDLSVAMRASMAVPGAFAPVDREGRLLVDGMLVRNLPVDVARKACADVVIAVPVSNPALKRADMTDALVVIGQAMNVAIEGNEKVQLATLTERDVAVPVVLKNIGSGDFAKVPDAIPIGEAAARQVADKLRRYSLPPAEYAAWRAGLTPVAQATRATVDEVTLTGLNYVNPKVAETFIEVKPGDPYDPAAAGEDAVRLAGRGDFDAVDYQLVQQGGRNVLVYKAHEKQRGPDYLMFDLNLATDWAGDTVWGLRVDYDKRWMNSLGGEWRTSFQVGRPNLFVSEFYQPLDLHQRFFVAPGIYASQTLQDLWQGDNRLARYDVKRYGVRLDAGIAMENWGEFRAGVTRGGLELDLDIGAPSLPSGNISTGALTAQFLYDTADRPFFTEKGANALVQAYSSQTGLGADESYTLMSGAWNNFFSWNRNVVQLNLSGGTGFGTDVPVYDGFSLGGLFRFSGYQLGQLQGDEYAFGAVNFRRRVWDLDETLGTAVYAGISLEAGNVYQRNFEATPPGVLLGGALYLGANTKLGPVYVGYGYSEGGHSAFYLYIGSSLGALRP
ncbi:MAG TPA: patatin-like phospholipase family protein [Burkholderiales bacterium]